MSLFKSINVYLNDELIHKNIDSIIVPEDIQHVSFFRDEEETEYQECYHDNGEYFTVIVNVDGSTKKEYEVFECMKYRMRYGLYKQPHMKFAHEPITICLSN